MNGVNLQRNIHVGISDNAAVGPINGVVALMAFSYKKMYSLFARTK